MLLQEHPELDRDRVVLNLLLEDVFAAKSAARARRDWRNSLRLHFVLGTIFERPGRWGPETDARTAVFQWRAALDAEERVLAEDKSSSRSPGLYVKPGDAYPHFSPPKPELAREQYINAVQAFESTGRIDEAEEARRKASEVAAR